MGDTGSRVASGRRRLTVAEGRKFGLTLAAGFTVLGALFAWRGHPLAARVLWAVALVSAAGGLLVPTRLAPVERAWMALGVALSHVVRPVFFSILYFLVITPAGLLRRSIGTSPLARKAGDFGYWHRREPREPEVVRRALERQF